MILVIYVDDILLVSNDLGMIRETKDYLASYFDMKDKREATFIIEIEMFQDRSQGSLGLS